MHAMLQEKPGEPLVWTSLPTPSPGPGEILLRIEACGVCRTDLHVIDGELPQARWPVIPGHECVGIIKACGTQVADFSPGERVGVPWLGGTCQMCRPCREGRENLCDAPEWTGCTRPGGFATHMLARADYAIRLSSADDPVAVAPLLCAGLIGWRALRKAGAAARLGLYGFGASAHIVAQVALARGQEVYAFTRPGDDLTQAFARRLGVCWTGGSDVRPPVPLDAAILFAPDGRLVPLALQAVDKGGRVVCAGIHMSDLPSMPYRLLWEERELLSVANLTRTDAHEFFGSPFRRAIITSTRIYPLIEANQALDDLRRGRFQGAAVLRPPPGDSL